MFTEIPKLLPSWRAVALNSASFSAAKRPPEMIDRGRWFFPNIEVDDHGADKELGYRGYRHELLDGLVSAYRCLQRLDYQKRENNKSLRNDLTAAKRHFVGQVQRVIEPNTRRIEWESIRFEVHRRNDVARENDGGSSSAATWGRRSLHVAAHNDVRPDAQ
jgi:hypothetical protein